MVKGIHLSLLMGPAVPVPVPKSVIEALTDVQVTTSAGQASGFQLTFTLSAKSVLNTLLLTIGEVGPIVRVILIVTVNGTPNVIMDGVITHHEVSPKVEEGRSTLTLTGEDLTRVMDLFDFTGIPYPAMPPEARVALIVAKYAFLGIIPMVIPSILIDLPIPVDRIPTHQGKDLAYIKQLADEVGYVFYLDPGPAPGTSLAYWGPEIKIGKPQPALNVNMNAHTNVESLNFNYDSTRATIPVVYIQQQATKAPIPIPIPDISPINPPLGFIPPFKAKLDYLTHTAKYSPIRAAAIGLAIAAKSSEAVSGSGTLDVLRYGRILKARQLVGVRGAGQAFDGLYYVRSVTHRIKRGEYKQSFELSRNGLVSTVPKVPA
jgi:hypothetical protein